MSPLYGIPQTLCLAGKGMSKATSADLFILHPHSQKGHAEQHNRDLLAVRSKGDQEAVFIGPRRRPCAASTVANRNIPTTGPGIRRSRALRTNSPSNPQRGSVNNATSTVAVASSWLRARMN